MHQYDLTNGFGGTLFSHKTFTYHYHPLFHVINLCNPQRGVSHTSRFTTQDVSRSTSGRRADPKMAGRQGREAARSGEQSCMGTMLGHRA